jgi:hypothetical protein
MSKYFFSTPPFRRILNIIAIYCPNDTCRQLCLTVSLYTAKKNPNTYYYDPDKVTETWNLLPQAKIMSFPDVNIPQGILDDYKEACLILNLSPKASATLSRRCIQGIIRDFYGAKGNNLKSEIESISSKADPYIISAIDSVRKIGNIGAHMEKEINLIIDIDPNEAELLVSLIELLIKETYVLKDQRDKLLTDVIDLSKNKSAIKSREDKAE